MSCERFGGALNIPVPHVRKQRARGPSGPLPVLLCPQIAELRRWECWEMTRGHVVAGVLLALSATAFLGCHDDKPSGPNHAADVSAPTTGAPGRLPGGGSVPLPPTTSAKPVSAESERTVAVVAGSNAAPGALALSEVQRRCLGARLDADLELRGALGADPLQSPRYGDLVQLAKDCINATTNADRFATSLSAQSGGRLSATQLACVRDGYAVLPGDEVSKVIQGGLTPGSADPEAGKRLRAVLDSCGVDQALLSPIGTG